MIKYTPKDVQRFWIKVKLPDLIGTDECWLWTSNQSRGYGLFKLNGKSEKAHRFSWVIANGDIPDGLWVLHTCDVPGCVNPAHLWLGTVLDNNADRQRKGRTVIPDNRGNNHGMAKLTEDQVLQIRKRYAAGGITHQELADEHGVSNSRICYIVNRKNWDTSEFKTNC